MSTHVGDEVLDAASLILGQHLLNLIHSIEECGPNPIEYR